jgi:hypothetical protein
VGNVEIEIRAIELTGQQVESLPIEERVLLVQIGHLANAITILGKWLIFCRAQATPQNVEVEAEATQQMLVTRILSGVLYEGWQIIQESYFKAQLSKKYDSKLTPDGQNSLATLKQYFRRPDNKIKQIRKKFAFHFDRAAVLNELSVVEREKSYYLYLSEFSANCLWYLSEELVGLAMLRVLQDLTGALGVAEALQQMIEELSLISGAFIGFASAWSSLVVRENLPSATWNDLKRIEVADVSPLDQIQIPFFIAKPDGVIR